MKTFQEFTHQKNKITESTNENKIAKLNLSDSHWFFRKIDSTHFYMANNRDVLDKEHPNGILARHVGEFRDKPYYDDLVDWLHDKIDIDGNTY